MRSNKNPDGFIEQGGNVDDFLVSLHERIAKPGSIALWAVRAEGAKEQPPSLARIIGGAKLGARVETVGWSLSQLAGATIARRRMTTVAEEAVELGENLGLKPARLFAKTVFAKMGIIGEGLPLHTSSLATKKRALRQRWSVLVSKRLDNMPSFFRVPKGYLGAEKIIADIGKTARGEKGAAAQTFHGVETSALGRIWLSAALSGESVAAKRASFAGEITGGVV